jgi:hypothetical protein
LPFHISFIANIARKRPELKQGKTKAPGQAVLQQQVLALFDRLKQRPEDVLSGQFIPFRSPRLNQLRNLQYSLKFGEKLWTHVFAKAKPKLVVTLGFDTLPHLQRILGVDQIEKIPVNWGNYCARRGRFSSGRMLRNTQPHLSTFKIMKREKSAPALDALFDEVIDDRGLECTVAFSLPDGLQKYFKHHFQRGLGNGIDMPDMLMTSCGEQTLTHIASC